MPRLIWLSDTHLNFCNEEQVTNLITSMNYKPTDKVVISGDIADSKTLMHFLNRIPVDYFVLGNHDFYHASTSFIRAQLMESSGYLSQRGPIKLNKDTVILGHDGWADGLNTEECNIDLNDFYLIGDFKGINRETVMRALSHESVRYIYGNLVKALMMGSHVYLITHVPPFIKAAIESRNASYFINRSMGDAIKRIMSLYPENQLTILCGHTHEARSIKMDNIEMHVAGAEYYHPKISGIFEI